MKFKNADEQFMWFVGIYEGEEVPLDTPMLVEVELEEAKKKKAEAVRKKKEAAAKKKKRSIHLKSK